MIGTHQVDKLFELGAGLDKGGRPNERPPLCDLQNRLSKLNRQVIGFELPGWSLWDNVEAGRRHSRLEFRSRCFGRRHEISLGNGSDIRINALAWPWWLNPLPQTLFWLNPWFLSWPGQ